MQASDLPAAGFRRIWNDFHEFINMAQRYEFIQENIILHNLCFLDLYKVVPKQSFGYNG